MRGLNLGDGVKVVQLLLSLTPFIANPTFEFLYALIFKNNPVKRWSYHVLCGQLFNFFMPLFQTFMF